MLVSGGGTGGHVFPAIAIADAIRNKMSDVDILFVGAKGRMEMEKVPSAGYHIIGLSISGFQRKFTARNAINILKLIWAMFKAWAIVRKFRPDIAIGVGGYASGPVLKISEWMGVTTAIQEQNSYAGMTNRILANGASKIFVAYEGMEKFFPKNKIVLTGNPVRKDIVNKNITTEEAKAKLGLDQNKKTILILGGSLGARTLNESVAGYVSALRSRGDLQVFWQVGKLYYDEFKNSEIVKLPNIFMVPFIDDMKTAYAAADIIISRAGALTISELTIVGKPSILVPSPNVAEDHQTENAKSLLNKKAALMVKDDESRKKLIPLALKLLDDVSLQAELALNISNLAKPNAADAIAEELIKMKEKI